MRNFEKGLVQLAYYVGPLLFGLNKYALEHPNKCLNKDTTLFIKDLTSGIKESTRNSFITQK